jgi:hypothetical protein
VRRRVLGAPELEALKDAIGKFDATEQRQIAEAAAEVVTASKTPNLGDLGDQIRQLLSVAEADPETPPESEPPLSAPSISQQPTDQAVTAPATATFSVTASGHPDPTYQWQNNASGDFADIPGATSSAYTTPDTDTEMSGYQYRAVVSNSEGSVNSDAATLTVTAASEDEGEPEGEGAKGSVVVMNGCGLTAQQEDALLQRADAIRARGYRVQIKLGGVPGSENVDGRLQELKLVQQSLLQIKGGRTISTKNVELLSSALTHIEAAAVVIQGLIDSSYVVDDEGDGEEGKGVGSQRRGAPAGAPPAADPYDPDFLAKLERSTNNINKRK